MTDDCSLCKREDRGVGWFYITMCDTCGVLMIVSATHKAEFSMEDKADILTMFPDALVRWEMRDVKDHAHCHIEKLVHNHHHDVR